MPSKRDVLAQLSREELISVVERFELEVADRRKKDDLLEAVASSRKATLSDVLPDLNRERLKELCVALGLDDGGREKATLVARLTGASKEAAGEPRPEPTAKGNGTTKATASQTIDLALGEKLTREKLEGYLWSAADILRGSIDWADGWCQQPQALAFAAEWSQRAKNPVGVAFFMPLLVHAVIQPVPCYYVSMPLVWSKDPSPDYEFARAFLQSCNTVLGFKPTASMEQST